MDIALDSLPTCPARYRDFTALADPSQVNFAILPQAAFPADFGFPSLKPGAVVVALHLYGIPKVHRLSNWRIIYKKLSGCGPAVVFVAKQPSLGGPPGGRSGPFVWLTLVGSCARVGQACFVYMKNWGPGVCRPGVFRVQVLCASCARTPTRIGATSGCGIVAKQPSLGDPPGGWSGPFVWLTLVGSCARV